MYLNCVFILSIFIFKNNSCGIKSSSFLKKITKPLPEKIEDLGTNYFKLKDRTINELELFYEHYLENVDFIYSIDYPVLTKTTEELNKLIIKHYNSENKYEEYSLPLSLADEIIRKSVEVSYNDCRINVFSEVIMKAIVNLFIGVEQENLDEIKKLGNNSIAFHGFSGFFVTVDSIYSKKIKDKHLRSRKIQLACGEYLQTFFDVQILTKIYEEISSYTCCKCNRNS